MVVGRWQMRESRSRSSKARSGCRYRACRRCDWQQSRNLHHGGCSAGPMLAQPRRQTTSGEEERAEPFARLRPDVVIGLGSSSSHSGYKLRLSASGEGGRGVGTPARLLRSLPGTPGPMGRQRARPSLPWLDDEPSNPGPLAGVRLGLFPSILFPPTPCLI
ncbi:hypothetical protein LX36DRAFT_150756 [Colletotrichum falcatum]|nr:hypothetical protein LX36DRAFT_150756 [Colletotrichum falcatum]